MGVSKVTLNGDTLMDITSDTVDQSNLLTGFTAHGADGENVAGGYTPTTYDIATTASDGLMSSADKIKLNGITAGAEVNQNAFSNVKIGSTTVAADTKTDTLTLTAGNNITLTPNTSTDSITIAVNGMPSKVSDLTNDSGYTTNTGTVTSIVTGAGLTGGTISTTGTIKADLKSDTRSSLIAVSKGTTTGREYAVGLDTNGYLSVNIPWENTQTVTGVKGSSESSYRTGNVSISKSNIGLGNVENKSSETIRGELTKSNVTTALGYTPYTQDEVNSLISSVFTYKGTKATYSQVSSLTGMKTGDVWQVTEDNSEYVYNGTAWEKLGPTIDLSGYLASVSVAGQVLTPSSNSITVAQLKSALGLGSAAGASTASSVGNNTNLPTGAAIQSYVTGLGYTKNTGTVTKVSTGDGLVGGDITTTGTISLDESGVTAGSAGPTAAVTGNEGNTIAVPRITVDKYGRVTALTSYNLTNKNTTYSVATTSTNGLMSSTDKTTINNLGTLASKNAATSTYTPAGTISTPTITVTTNETVVNSITSVGTLPSLGTSVTGEKLTISWSAGTLPTQGANTTVATGIKTATSSQPTFSGTAATLSVS